MNMTGKSRYIASPSVCILGQRRWPSCFGHQTWASGMCKVCGSNPLWAKQLFSLGFVMWSCNLKLMGRWILGVKLLPYSMQAWSNSWLWIKHGRLYRDVHGLSYVFYHRTGPGARKRVISTVHTDWIRMRRLFKKWFQLIASWQTQE